MFLCVIKYHYRINLQCIESYFGNIVPTCKLISIDISTKEASVRNNMAEPSLHSLLLTLLPKVAYHPQPDLDPEYRFLDLESACRFKSLTSFEI